VLVRCNLLQLAWDKYFRCPLLCGTRWHWCLVDNDSFAPCLPFFIRSWHAWLVFFFLVFPFLRLKVFRVSLAPLNLARTDSQNWNCCTFCLDISGSPACRNKQVVKRAVDSAKVYANDKVVSNMSCLSWFILPFSLGDFSIKYNAVGENLINLIEVIHFLCSNNKNIAAGS
jgi:hypothetical protein